MIPNEMKKYDNWVGFKLTQLNDGKLGKLPINCKTGKAAKSNDSSTWSSYEIAEKAMKKYGYDCLGFAFNGNGIIGIDLDHCIENNELSDIALDVLSKIQSYTETSPSGTGLHIIALGAIPKGPRKNSKIEMYDNNRFFTVTGKNYKDCSDTVKDCSEGINQVYYKYLHKEKKVAEAIETKKSSYLSDEEVVEKAKAASNGTTFSKLYNGDISDYDSHSEADMALCSLLAFWTAKDATQMERLFVASRLYRPNKWNKRHHANGNTYGKETIQRAIDNCSKVYKKPKEKKQTSSAVEPVIFEIDFCYYKTRADGARKRITNFLIEPKELLNIEAGSVINTIITNDRGEVFNKQFALKDFANLQSFKKNISSDTLSLIYTGTEGDLELIKEHISRKTFAKRQGYEGIGIARSAGKSEIVPNWVYAGENFSIDSSGNVVQDIVSIEKTRSIKSDIEKREQITRFELEQAGKVLLSYNELPKTATVLCWCAACFVKPKLVERGVKFPHLILDGEQGSGKSSTTEKVIIPLFSTSQSVGASKITNFTFLKAASSSNCIPYIIDEYKPSTMEQGRVETIHNGMRDLYDGHEGERGKADMTVKKYKLSSPLVLIGEESPSEASLKERSIELLFSKYDIKDKKEYAELLLKRKEQISMLGKAMLVEALKQPASRLRDVYDSCLETLDKDLPDRVKSNIAVCLVGLYIVDRVCISYGTDFQKVFAHNKTDIKKALLEAVSKYTLYGGNYNKSIVDKTFEVFDRMTELLKLDIHYKAMSNNREIAFDIKRIYDLYTKYRRECALSGESLHYDMFITQLKKKDYYVSYKSVGMRRNDLVSSTRTVKCYVVKARELAQKADISNLLSSMGIVLPEVEQLKLEI